MESQMKKEALIIHYNTPELTEATIRSLWKQCGSDWHVTVFDNSDKIPFWRPMDGVTVIDNTRGQVIDFDKFLDTFPDRDTRETSNFGSTKHCKSVDLCFDLLPDGFMLMDSDIVLKTNVNSMVDDSLAWTGKVTCNTDCVNVHIERISPFLCWINVPMFREHGIRYFNPEKMWKLTKVMPNRYYDVGAWLLEESRRLDLPCKEINVDSFIEHFRGGSWRKCGDEKDYWLANMSRYYK